MTPGMESFSSEDILGVLRLSNQDREARWQVIDDFGDDLKALESFKGAQVEIYGSFACDLSTRSGDLDISIEDEYKDLNLKKGKIPIVLKFKYKDIPCDVTIMNYPSRARSSFFTVLAEADTRFKDLVLLLKEWGETAQLLGTCEGLNSYCLYLMLLFHLQTCDPPIFPPIKEIYVLQFENSCANWLHMLDACTNIKLDACKDNTSSLDELLISFFDKFAGISSKAKTHVMSTFTGEWVERGTHNQWTNSEPLVIEDPFEITKNAAKRVMPASLSTMASAFIQASEMFKKAHGKLLSQLIRPHTRIHN